MNADKTAVWGDARRVELRWAWLCGIVHGGGEILFLTRRTQCRIKHLESLDWMVFSDAAWAGGLDGRSAGGRAPFVSKELFGVAFCRILSRCGLLGRGRNWLPRGAFIENKGPNLLRFVILVWVRCRSRHAGPRAAGRLWPRSICLPVRCHSSTVENEIEGNR